MTKIIQLSVALAVLSMVLFGEDLISSNRFKTDSNYPVFEKSVSTNKGNTSPSANSTVAPHDDGVTIGKPILIRYSQIFPLLDGLFQDVSSISLAGLNLNPNTPNASNLDAVLQQFQMSVQYSQLLGAQNAATARQLEAQSMNLASQNQINSQVTSQTMLLLSQLQIAQQQAFQALQDLNNSAPDSPERANAQTRLDAANQSVTQIQAQIAMLRTLNSNQNIGNPTFSTSNTVANLPGFPANIGVSPSIPSLSSNANTGAPTFSASKQMENQIELLWERLANLVNTLSLSQPGSDEGSEPNVYLVKFNTGILAKPRKKNQRLLTTTYRIECIAPDNNSKNKPNVLDLFPRTSAVNIAGEKFRSSRFALAGIAAFFSAGVNAAYSRESLKQSRTLSQAAYTTGFGIQSDRFGWTFGPSFAEDTPSPGSRTTYALVSVPNDCKKLKILPQDIYWHGRKSSLNVASRSTEDWMWEIPHESQTSGDRSNGNSPSTARLSSLSYSPTEFVANQSAIVTINLSFDRNLDREQIVSVNGKTIKRARDKYGRGVTGETSYAGFLQSLDGESAETWFPVSLRTMQIKLDARNFGNRFPQIVLSGQTGAIDVSSLLSNCGETEVNISGRKIKFEEADACLDLLPPPGRKAAEQKPIHAVIWKNENTKGKQSILFWVSESQDQAEPKSKPNTGRFAIDQFPSNQYWSSIAQVTSYHQQPENRPLQCMPFGRFLKCELPKDYALGDTRYEIYDSEYSGRSIKGFVNLPNCKDSQCSGPTVIGHKSPRWVFPQWKIELEMINVNTSSEVFVVDHLSSTNAGFKGEIEKSCGQTEQTCSVVFSFDRKKFRQITDNMRISVQSSGKEDRSIRLVNLRSDLLPVLFGKPSADMKELRGTNLVWEKIVSDMDLNKFVNYQCSNGDTCSIKGSGFESRHDGFLYFVVETDDGPEYLPLRYSDNTGIFTLPRYVTPKTKKAKDDVKEPFSSDKSIIRLQPNLRILQ